MYNYTIKTSFFSPEVPDKSYDFLQLWKLFSSMASKLFNIRWIRTGSMPYLKTMYSIVLCPVFYEYKKKYSFNIKPSYVSPEKPRKAVHNTKPFSSSKF